MIVDLLQGLQVEVLARQRQHLGGADPGEIDRRLGSDRRVAPHDHHFVRTLLRRRIAGGRPDGEGMLRPAARGCARILRIVDREVALRQHGARRGGDAVGNGKAVQRDLGHHALVGAANEIGDGQQILSRKFRERPHGRRRLNRKALVGRLVLIEVQPGAVIHVDFFPAGVGIYRLDIDQVGLRVEVGAHRTARLGEERDGHDLGALDAQHRNFHALLAAGSVGCLRVVIGAGGGGLEQPEDHPHVRRRGHGGAIANPAQGEIVNRGTVQRGIPFQVGAGFARRQVLERVIGVLRRHRIAQRIDDTRYEGVGIAAAERRPVQRAETSSGRRAAA